MRALRQLVANADGLLLRAHPHAVPLLRQRLWRHLPQQQQRHGARVRFLVTAALTGSAVGSCDDGCRAHTSCGRLRQQRRHVAWAHPPLRLRAAAVPDHAQVTCAGRVLLAKTPLQAAPQRCRAAAVHDVARPALMRVLLVVLAWRVPVTNNGASSALNLLWRQAPHCQSAAPGALSPLWHVQSVRPGAIMTAPALGLQCGPQSQSLHAGG